MTDEQHGEDESETEEADEVIYLTLEQVHAIHAEQLALRGGKEGCLFPHAIEHAVAAPSSSGFGQEYHPTIEAKAAAYLFYIAEAHAFEEGNKRTAAKACVDFLAMNGFELETEPRQLSALTRQVVKGKVCRADVREWIEIRIRPIT